MTENDLIRLRHMIRAAVEAREFYREWLRQKDTLKQALYMAMIRCLEILGEAAGKIIAPVSTYLNPRLYAPVPENLKIERHFRNSVTGAVASTSKPATPKSIGGWLSICVTG